MIALSGTPGTGKTSVGEELVKRGHCVIELNRFIQNKGLLGRIDRKRCSYEVDLDELASAMSHEDIPEGAILIGHFAHELDVEYIIVLRCRPSVLRSRLEIRGYPEHKIKENLEAEALDVILIEALNTGKEVLEIDTTNRSVKETADAVEEILGGERKKYEAGHLDWSEEVLDWF